MKTPHSIRFHKCIVYLCASLELFRRESSSPKFKWRTLLPGNRLENCDHGRSNYLCKIRRRFHPFSFFVSRFESPSKLPSHFNGTERRSVGFLTY